MTLRTIANGKLLIAQPAIISDLTFNRAIILLTDHTNKGSVGFILNKPLKYFLKDLIPNINGHFGIFNGGPVEQDNLYFIHNVPELIGNSLEISNGIYWGGDFEITRKLINSGEIKPSNIRFFLGYTGWDANQLHSEVKSNSWIVTENDYKSKIFEKPSDTFWKEKIEEMGGDFVLWSNAPENPNYN